MNSLGKPELKYVVDCISEITKHYDTIQTLEDKNSTDYETLNRENSILNCLIAGLKTYLNEEVI